MQKHLVGAMLAGLAGTLAVPATAFAQAQAFTSTTVGVYAGPAADYPLVAQVPGGASVAVMGCVAGYSWCDVSTPGLRGWVYGGYLNYPYQGSPVPLLNYGATIGLPIVTFSLGTYWGRYYRNRPWFGNQQRWMHHAPPGRVPPPAFHGRPPAGRPPVHGGGRPSGPPPAHGGGRPPQGPVHGGGRPPGGGPAHGGGRPEGGRPAGGGGDDHRPG